MKGCDKCLPWQMDQMLAASRVEWSSGCPPGWDFCTSKGCLHLYCPIWWVRPLKSPACLGVFTSNPLAVATTQPLKDSKPDPKELATNLERHSRGEA